MVDNIFSMFNKSIARHEAIKQPFSIFASSALKLPPSRQKSEPQSTGVLKAVYGRQPIYWNSMLNSEVQATIDTTHYWPLSNKIVERDFTAVAGTNTRLLELDALESHYLVLNLSTFADASSAAAPPQVRLDLVRETNTAFGTASVMLGQTTIQSAPTGAVSATVPLIGGFSSMGYNSGVAGGVADVRREYTGMRPVYIANGHDLLLTYFNLSAGFSVLVRANVIELPSSQPFGQLISTL